MKPLAQNTMIQGRYLIVQLIGKGGMGEVYLAVDQRLGSAVALKRTFFAGDVTLGNAFEREARILARMRHPVLPKVSDHFGDGDEQYLVMEHISGDDLAKRLEVAQKPFPLSWVMFWADQLLDALSYLHSHEPPIIHRDIKPQNLKLTDENHIILLDFGLSKSSTGNTLINHPDGSTTGGSTASVVGYTPHYAPMEQIRGIGTSSKSDIYSLSATLYQLLSNVIPADALSRADEMLNGLPDPIRSLTDINHEIPQPVSDVILRGMEVSQDKRYVTAREMQKALRKAFATMQDAMSAKTVAFSGDAFQPAAVGGDQPISPSFDETEVMDFGVLAAEVAKEDHLSGGGQEFADPNSNNSAPENSGDSYPKQSDLKTEVFLADSGASPFPVPELPTSEPEKPDYEADVSEENFAPTEDYGNFSDQSGEDDSDQAGFDPGATMPIVSYEAQQQSYDSSSSSYHSQPDGQAHADEHDEVEKAAAAAAGVAAAPAKPKKKGSGGKIVGIFVGLFAVFALALGAIGGGYYYYNNYYMSALPEPSPSPEPTLEITPTPEPTIESVFNANTDENTNANANTNVNANANENANVVPVSTPAISDRTTTTPRPRVTPTPRPRTTPTRPAPTPAVRPTATPRPRILQ